jgi:hypothetical protein
MADDGSKQSAATWPLVKFSFNVKFLDGNEVIFQEVTGLSTENKTVDHRYQFIGRNRRANHDLDISKRFPM